MPRQLTVRELNRTLLDRQWLLERRSATAVDVAQHLIGLQAQQGNPPYYGIWSRADGPTIDDISAAILDKRLARVVLMRGTIHLATADDCLNLRAVVQPHLDRTLWDSTYGKRSAGVDPKAVVEVGLAALIDGPMSNKDIGVTLEEAFPGHDGNALAYLLRTLTPLVQTPPRGVWGRGGTLRYASAENWFGRPPGTDDTPDETLLRYLAAFGPASVHDMRKWSAVTGLATAVDRLRPKLRTYTAPDGRELFDLADASISDPDTHAPARLLAAFDNALMLHTTRERIIDADSSKRIFTKNGIVEGTFLVDGFVAGSWKPTITKTSASISLTPFRSIDREWTDALVAEAERILRIAAPDVADRDVVIVDD
ncbi:winged helix DNA-binding domain-containing protein [Stackebrandtia soli]|uniref:winged helix DNA-binding domain-containing protein n=1 Tax=Stackebrandtia soli TaxID=1892856 RepID=UPI0039EA20EA